MALPTLAKAREWFESNFDEVHVYDPETHPPSLKASFSPNGYAYVEVVNGRLMIGGHQYPESVDDERKAASEWFAAVTDLYALMGRPKFLWWRTLPEYENGRIYSRLMMTDTGPYLSYRGKPVPKFKASDHGR